MSSQNRQIIQRYGEKSGLDDVLPDVLDDARTKIVEHLNAAISELDATRPVRSILEDRILRVKDTKLSRLLNEFNAHREHAPNLCAISYRTILSLVIIERAKYIVIYHCRPVERTRQRQDAPATCVADR